MNKRLLILLAACCLLLTGFAFAQENLGARPMGMGGAFTGLADDANAIFINPAGIGNLQGESMVVSTRISEDREYTLIGGVENTIYGNLGLGYVGSSDPIEGNGDSPIKYTTQTLYVAYARDVNQAIRVPKNMGRLSLGVNLKFSSRKLGTAQGLYQDGGSNIDIDLATVFKPTDNFSLGLSLQNFLNGKNAADIAGLDTVEEREGNVLLGASGKLFNGKVTWVAENDELGCEWKPARGFALRVGQGKDSTTSGFGININGFGIDYAYMQKRSPVHYFSVSIIPKETTGQTEVKRASINLE